MYGAPVSCPLTSIKKAFSTLSVDPQGNSREGKYEETELCSNGPAPNFLAGQGLLHVRGFVKQADVAET